MLPWSSPALPDAQSGVIAAANAAASWARARRATWGDTTFTDCAEAEVVAQPALEDERSPAHVDGPSAVEKATAWAQSLSAPLLPWLPRVAAIALLIALAGIVAVYFGGTVRAYWTSATAATKPVVRQDSTTAVRRKATGGLRVSTEPPGAQVLVDGKVRGITPLTLDDLPVGAHAVVLQSTGGSVQRTVTIKAAQTADMDEAIFAGWLAVFAPFDIAITEGARTIHLDERNQIMLPSGPHTLHLENRALGYEEVRQVEVGPGEVGSLRVAPLRSTMTVKATESAEVWVDGVLTGETPLIGQPVDLGTHEVVVKRAGDQRRFVVTVTVKPVDLSVDFSKPVA